MQQTTNPYKSAPAFHCEDGSPLTPTLTEQVRLYLSLLWHWECGKRRVSMKNYDSAVLKLKCIKKVYYFLKNRIMLRQT